MYVRKPFLLHDGTDISIQASEFHYCTPRNNSGPYTEFEVLPSIPVPEWREYDTGGDGAGPYAYVPLEKVREYIEMHGGFDVVDAISHRAFIY